MPATDSAEDLARARLDDGLTIRWYMDALLRGSYPEDVLEFLGEDAPQIAPGDMEAIRQPLDFLGINYYTRNLSGTGAPLDPVESGREVTDMGWEVFPAGLTELLLRLKADYRLPPLYITENGAAYRDRLVDGRVADADRIRYLHPHIAAMADALESGVDVRGYFVWSLLDNFEWADGYTKRFGLVYVDYATQRRTLKDSALWYRAFCSRARAATGGGSSATTGQRQWPVRAGDGSSSGATSSTATELDPTKWDFELGNGFFDYKTHQWVPGWGNEELQYYTREPDNVSVRDSLLYIRALKEPLHGCGYTSARIRTRQRDGTPLFSQALRQVRVPRQGAARQGPVARDLAAAAGRQVRRMGGLRRDRRHGDRRREASASTSARSTSGRPSRSANSSRTCTSSPPGSRWGSSTSMPWSGSRARSAGRWTARPGRRSRSGGAAASCATARGSSRAAVRT